MQIHKRQWGLDMLEKKTDWVDIISKIIAAIFIEFVCLPILIYWAWGVVATTKFNAPPLTFVECIALVILTRTILMRDK